MAPSVPPEALLASAIEGLLLSLVVLAERICTFGPRVKWQRTELFARFLRAERLVEYEYELKGCYRAGGVIDVFPEPTSFQAVPTLTDQALADVDEFDAALVHGASGAQLGAPSTTFQRRDRKRAKQRRERSRAIVAMRSLEPGE